VSDESIDIVTAALVAAVRPASVVEIGPDPGAWSRSFERANVPSTPVLTDLRSPFTLEARADLAVCDVGERVPIDVVGVFVASLCASADVVAFAAALPGLAPDACNERWPAWWDSVFEEHRYVPHDVIRPVIWDDVRVDLALRQSMVLYARPGGVASTGVPALATRFAVHAEAHQRSLEMAAAREHERLSAANHRADELDAELARVAERARTLELDLEAAKARSRIAEPPPIEGLSPLEAQFLVAEEESRVAHADVTLLWSALAAAHRELAAASFVSVPSLTAIRTTPKVAVARAVSGLLPLRTAFRRILGPRAPVFDQHYYLSRYPDVTAGALSPLWHYRRHGARTRRSPHQFFDPEWYASTYPDAVAGGVDPLEDYVTRGWRQGRDPHPLFSGEWYRSHTSLGRWRRSPLEHYIAHGAREGLSPHPLLDLEWYRRQNPDVASSGVDPLQHFLSRGWWEGRSPHPLFDVRWYLETYEQVAYQGLNPLVDYLTLGWRQGRDPHPLFDSSWYLEHHPEVAESGLEPFTHFVLRGAAEGRATSPLFDTAWYVREHPEAAEGGRNPLEFFVTVGLDRGDLPSPSVARLGGIQDFRVQPSPLAGWMLK